MNEWDMDHTGRTSFGESDMTQGIYACPDHVTEPDGSCGPDPLTDSDIARLAYEMADAMLHAREVK